RRCGRYHRVAARAALRAHHFWRTARVTPARRRHHARGAELPPVGGCSTIRATGVPWPVARRKVPTFILPGHARCTPSSLAHAPRRPHLPAATYHPRAFHDARNRGDTAMISLKDVRRLIDTDSGDSAVLSLYLDMSINSDNKRTWGIFLSRQRAGFAELDSANGRREPVARILARVERWIDEEFRPGNRGLAIFATIDGARFEALQFPVRVENRLVIGDAPLVWPLRELVETSQRHAVVLVDRRRMRVLTVCMNTIEDELLIEKDEHPANHDVRAGGEAASNYQNRKAEEARSFFREF